MGMATNSVSTFVIFFIVLFISGISEIGAQHSQCLEEYSGAPLSYCTARIAPSLCYYKCRSNKSAIGGQCDGRKCFCDFCIEKPVDQSLSNV